MSEKLSTQPYKGTKDLFPKDFAVQKYIFDTWRSICKSYGYEEYQTPIIELAEIYRVRSGENVGSKQLFTLTDLKGRELALRPELTPSVTRMVARKYKELPKPIRLFSIGSFYRNERPQRGRNREFWQLNFDIFGDESIFADLEIIRMSIEIMLAFNPPPNSFKLYLNNRKLTDAFFKEILKIDSAISANVAKVIDKSEKLSPTELEEYLANAGLSKKQIEETNKYIMSNYENIGNNYPILLDTEGYKEISELLNILKDMEYGQCVEFKTSLMRGLDYYDGTVFEIFDLNPQNNRSLFGGGRYNGLAEIFGSDNFPAVGVAPGNETTKLFLESWNLIPNLDNPNRIYLACITPKMNEAQLLTIKTANKLRDKTVNTSITEDLSSSFNANTAISNADKGNYNFAIIIGEKEVETNKIGVKDMKSGQTKSLETFISELS